MRQPQSAVAVSHHHHLLLLLLLSLCLVSEEEREREFSRGNKRQFLLSAGCCCQQLLCYLISRDLADAISAVSVESWSGSVRRFQCEKCCLPCSLSLSLSA